MKRYQKFFKINLNRNIYAGKKTQHISLQNELIKFKNATVHEQEITYSLDLILVELALTAGILMPSHRIIMVPLSCYSDRRVHS